MTQAELKKRLLLLEDARADSEPPVIFIVRTSMSNDGEGVIDTVIYDGQVWRREDGESDLCFQDRINQERGADPSLSPVILINDDQ